MCKVRCSLALIAIVAGCTTTPEYNKPLTEFTPTYGYRFENLEKAENSDDLFVILTFSGGGSRAAALSLSVLEKLAATEIEWNGRRCRMLDEVDLISGVSGGSFTAAYYGVFGDRVFTDFAQALYRKNNSMLVRAVLSLPSMIRQASPFYSRTDTAANRYSKKGFEGKTFGDLLANKKRPFILINATDMGLGRQFSFTQDYFDLIYSDLSTYPLGNAVAASSAFPGAFSALLLKNYEKGPDYAIDPWFAENLTTTEPGTIRYRSATDVMSYGDPQKKFVHLSDGGVSDNLGLLPILASLADPDQPMGLIPTIPAGSEQKIVLIVVNAASRPPDKLSHKGQPPGLFKLLGAAGTTPMGWFTEAQVGYLRLLIDYIQRVETAESGEATVPGTNAARHACGESPRKFYFTEVSFDKVPDSEERTFFQTIPTSFTLAPETVDRLRVIGGVILENDSVFKQLLAEIGAK